jgi:hypothetical protein
LRPNAGKFRGGEATPRAVGAARRAIGASPHGDLLNAGPTRVYVPRKGDASPNSEDAAPIPTQVGLLARIVHAEQQNGWVVAPVEERVADRTIAVIEARARSARSCSR